MVPIPEPFRLLSHREFSELTHYEKIAYLNAAVEEMARDVPAVAAIPPPEDET
jgi:hypothetical protein